ncbi:MAG TPA: hypothetical protein VM243_00515 [Phycisphaerae bacterium]|nr:hypothetical protein [Phycisphaerae bacterium]
MEPIRSGTTTERVIRTSILTLLFAGYSLWCFWDGYYAYPRHNAETLKENLTPVPQEAPAVNRLVTNAKIQALHKKTAKEKVEVTKAEVLELLGEPAAWEDDMGSFFGPGGLARITFQDDRVRKVRWFPGPKKESDLFTQFLMGCAVGLVGLGMILQWIRAVSTRVQLTDAGLKLNSQGGTRWGGSPLVPFEAMTGLRIEDYKRKGWVVVEYQLTDGREGTVSLNDYVHKAFPEIVAEICRRKGFENPIKPPEDTGDHDDKTTDGLPDRIVQEDGGDTGSDPGAQDDS